MINFDNAAATFPKPEIVRKAALYAMQDLGSPGRGGHRLAEKTSAAVYSAREKAASFFGAEPENVVFTMNCTYALNMAVNGIMHGGGHLIISSIEHNSAARPAFRLAEEGRISLSVAEVYPEAEKTLESFRSLIRHDTKAILCTIAGNVTGQLMPYREIGELCRSRGICFIADAAQACGLVDIKLSHGINIICAPGHKGLYGMTGTGLLISDGQYKLKPMILGGTGNLSQSLVQPELLPEALESGTLPTAGIMSLKAGIGFVEKIGIKKIFSHEEHICRVFAEKLGTGRNIVIYRDPAAEYVPIVAFNINGIPSERTAAYLSEKGYCLRAGYHCSALAHAHLGTSTGAVRFSPSVFSNAEDAVRLAELIINADVSKL